jgi:hypothetical protein
MDFLSAIDALHAVGITYGVELHTAPDTQAFFFRPAPALSRTVALIVFIIALRSAAPHLIAVDLAAPVTVIAAVACPSTLGAHPGRSAIAFGRVIHLVGQSHTPAEYPKAYRTLYPNGYQDYLHI